jgi:SCY1-like protein 2
VLPIVLVAIESPTPSLVDAALRSLPIILPVLDFSAVKNELFPVITTVFSRTNSLAIKVRGCHAFVILCGGSNDNNSADDGLDGLAPDQKKTSSSSVLDKYTMQEKIVPLIKAIKTKEPAVMMAALDVLRVVGDRADVDFVAIEILPILWNMSLGPLLDLKQFRSFMELIKSLSRRVEDEQTKKLQELTVTNGTATPVKNEDFLGFGGVTGTTFDSTNGSTADDFERLVKGKAPRNSSSSADAGWDAAPNSGVTSPTVKSPPVQFSWSTPTPAANSQFKPPSSQPSFRTVTPDLAAFGTLTPQTTQFSQPLQPVPQPAQTSLATQQSSSGINWSSTTAATTNPWASNVSKPASSVSSPMNTMAPSMTKFSTGQQRPSINQNTSFSLAPPPSAGSNTSSGFSLAPPPGGVQRQTSNSIGQPSSGFNALSSPPGSMNSMMNSGMGNGNRSMNSMNSMMGSGMSVMTPNQPQQQQQKPQGSGLDKYESLL